MKRQNEYIFCEENRYWVAVLGGGVSSVLIILLLLYFAASYYRRIDNYQAGFENRMLMVISDQYHFVNQIKHFFSDRSSKRGSVSIPNDVAGSIQLDNLRQDVPDF